MYIIAQILGAIIGAIIVYFAYLPHWQNTDDADAKLAVFATVPAIRHPLVKYRYRNDRDICFISWNFSDWR